jgi:uncharacterized ubiquitin-like protein YukD
MENKVLIKLLIPEINNSYDLFIPVNEIIWKVIKLIIKAVSDLSGALDAEKDYILINKDTGKIYRNNEIIIETEIRYGTELILLSCNQNMLSSSLVQANQIIQQPQSIVNQQPNNILQISAIPQTKN